MRIALLLRTALSCGTCATAHYESGFDDDFFGVGLLGWSIDALQNRFRRQHTHMTEWLPHGRKSRVLVRSALNIIEADHRNFLRDSAACFAQGLNLSLIHI